MAKSVLLFAYDYPPLAGGISRLCVAVVEELKSQNIDIEVLSIDRAIEDGFPIPDVKETRLVPSRPKLEWSALKYLYKYGRNKTVVTDLWYPEGLLSVLAGVNDLIVFAHGNDVMKGVPTLKNRMLTFLRNIVLRRARVVICDSHYTEGVVKKSVSSAKTRVVPLGVDTERFVPIKDTQSIREKHNLPSDKRLIFTMSRLQEYKAHDTVFKAIAAVPLEKRGNLHYVVAGRGPFESELKRMAKELGVDNHITWLGFAEENDIVELYNAMDLFVLCTKEEEELKQVEGFGLVFLEAQSCGTPCVGSNDGGIPDAVIPEQGGWLVERDDYDALAAILEKLVNTPELFVEEGRKGRERVVAHATWHHFGEQVRKITMN